MQIRTAGRALIALLLLLPLATAARAQETQDTTKLTAQLRTARADLNAAFAVRDAAKASAHFADSVMVQFGDQMFHGKPAATAWLTDALAGVTALRFGTPSFTVGASEVRERSTYVVVNMEGAEQPGNVTTVWRRQANGGWKIAELLVT